MLLNVCILIKREVGKGYENLVKFRDNIKKLIERHHSAQRSVLSLPSYNNLVKYMENAYKEGNYVRYI